MTTTAERRPPAIVENVRRLLERPLASYQLVLGATALLLGLGLIMVLSASSVYARMANGGTGNTYSVFIRQAMFAVLGLGGAYVAARMPLATMRRLVTPVLLVSVGLVVATFFLGVEIRGNKNWIPLFGGFMLQPSEFAKLAVVLWIGHWFASHAKAMQTPRLILLPMVPITMTITMLVVLQRDLGTALVLFSVIIGMLWVAGLPARQMSAVGAGVFALLVLFVATAPHRVARLLNFTNPLADPENAGYQSIHASMALARGGFWGVGLGGSRQKWGALPEAHTDFILAVMGEELGLLGTLVVLSLFLVLAVAGIRIATRARDPFARYVAAGITIWIVAQTAINVGMVLGLLPVIGIPLPLMSYGGSSLLVTLVAMGVLLNCAKTEPGAQRALQVSRAAKARGRARSAT
ncbi:putative lipid II flippase FtsW [Aeromicrobium sp. CF3.5]|uniref:putative lipid II flippase FtsW n=1 Tax=Aeromicrobium sp. CF3.5 TaxID=3373078 RepID=UPI003EE7D054